MIKRSLIAVALVLAVAFVGSVAYSSLFGSEPESAGKPKGKPKAVKPWDGRATKPYHLAFSRGGQQITLDRVSFRDLERMQSSVRIEMTIVSADGTRPSWINPRAFAVYNNLTEKRLPARVEVKKGIGSETRVAISLRVPSDLLGTSAAERANPRTFDEREALTLSLLGAPGAPLTILIDAPQPPPGHVLADPKVEEAFRRAVEVTATQIRGPRLTVKWRVNTDKARQVVIYSDNKRIRKVPAKNTGQITFRPKGARRHTIRLSYITEAGREVFPPKGFKRTARTKPPKSKKN